MARSPTSRRLDGHRRRSRSRDRRDDRERDHDRASDRRDRGRDDDRRERSRRDDDRRDVDRGGRDRERDRRDRERDGHDRHQGGRRDRDDDGYYSRRRDDGGRRHESRDRGHRSGYRERSRGPRRNTSRERSPVRDKQPRRGHRDDGLDNGNRERTTRRSYTPSDQNSRPPTANADRGDNGRKAPEPVLSREDREEQEKKKARVEAWAKKKKEMEEKKSVDASTSSTRADVPATSDPAAALDSPEPTQDEARPPSPGRTPFDPKAVKKRAEAKLKSMKNALGGDVAIPVSSNGVANGKRPTPGPRGLANGTVKQADAKIAAFDLSKTAGPQSADTTSKATTNLDDEDQVRRKFTKLPDLPQASEDDAAMANYDEDQDEGADDLHSDEEEAEAAREAAMKRAEEAQAEQQDVEMADAAAHPEAEQMEVDEEVDPLDAFMDTLDKAPPPPSRVPAKRNIREIQIFGEDDGPDLDAVGEDPDDILNNPKRKKKEIADVDHSKMDYEPIRKNFYSESLEIAEMTDEEIDALRFDMDNIKVNGKGAMRPITKWSHCGFSQQILEVINEHKFEKPTSIQSQALPAIMSGRDTIGVAKTGSGKTLAFVLPMFRHIKDQRPVTNLEGPIGLILAPTRELAVQIHRECKPYLKALNIRGACAYGGAPIKDQIADLKRGAEVVVCTPGRLIDLLAANAGRVMNLKRVSYVVMDEADRMLDMGFEPQITKLLGNIRPDRQLVAFSATFPKKMEFLAKKALKDPISIQVGERSVVAAEITQIIEIREEDTKFHRILQLIGDLYENDEDARTLIFVERQEMADSIFKHLCKMGYPTVAVHGAREQIDRDDAINNFRNGAIPIMVATSVAARGLDVQQLKLVINYDSPNHGEDYVHRAGRTGRAGNTGTAVTFVTPEQERFASFLVRALQDSKQEVPDKLKEMAESFKKKVDAGQAQKAGSGFGGHGIEKMEAARAAERVRLKGQFKTDDEPEEDDKDKEEKSKKEKAIEELVGKAAGAVKGRDAAPEKPAESSAAGQPLMDSDLEKHLTNALKVQKVEKMAAAPAADDPLARVAAVAATISSRIGANKGSTRPGAPADNRGPDAGAFHATLEINDFPQMARWGVTNRTNVAKILESTGTSITTKGTYYPPGKAPEEGELPKLYILVEGDTEVAVSQAMAELTRHLREGMAKSQEADARGGAGGPGRYKVLS